MRHAIQILRRKSALALRGFQARLHPRVLQAEQGGQDLIEYALLCGFMVIAVYVILPADLMPAISHIFSRLVGVASTLTNH